MHALDPLPGVISLEKHWPDWAAAIGALAVQAPAVETAAENDVFPLELLRRWVREAAGAPLLDKPTA